MSKFLVWIEISKGRWKECFDRLKKKSQNKAKKKNPTPNPAPKPKQSPPTAVCETALALNCKYNCKTQLVLEVMG